jgi:response regulator of citrate/malate metabolism
MAVTLTRTLADDDFEIADRIEAALDTAGPEGLTPSRAARKAKTDTVTARRVLEYLVDHAYAHTTGNGCWAHYHAGSAR